MILLIINPERSLTEFRNYLSKKFFLNLKTGFIQINRTHPANPKLIPCLLAIS
jgi:hypothetical protein